MMAEAKPYIFADKPVDQSDDLSRFDLVSEQFVEHLAAVLEQLVGQSADLTTQEPGIVQYSKWIDELAPLTSLSIYRLLPLRGCVILRIEEAMVAGLIEGCYGGNIGPSVTRSKEVFRETELRLIERLAQSLMEGLGECFSEYTIMKPAPITHETKPKYVNVCAPDERVFQQVFQVSFSEEITWDMELIFTAEALESALELMSSNGVEKPTNADPVWQQQWHERLSEIYLPLRTILAQPSMNLPQLFELKPGDIIPITPRAKPPLYVANHKFATGVLGEKDGCAAYKIDKIQEGTLS